MAYYARKDLLEYGSYFHITWQCHNNDFILKNDNTKKIYYDLLVKYKDKYGVKIFSYCLMGTHIHFVGTCEEVARLSAFMQLVNSIFARTYNKEHRKHGQVVMDRFKSIVIEDSKHMFVVIRYLDLNPYKARMVKHPRDYKWSSYRYYAFGEADALISRSPVYEEFGDTEEERRSAYIEMVDELANTEAGMAKQPYSINLFIGDPGWVEYKYQKLKLTKKKNFEELISP